MMKMHISTIWLPRWDVLYRDCKSEWIRIERGISGRRGLPSASGVYETLLLNK